MKSEEVYSGKGEAVVLLHGFLANKNYWTKLIPRLENNNVIALDLLGFGNAPKPKTSQYTYSSHIEHIQTQLKNLKIKSPFILAGHSMGAVIAARFALQNPNAVKKLIMLNPPLYSSADQAVQVLNDTGTLYRAILSSRLRFIIWPILRKVTPIAKHTRQSRELTLQNVILKSEFIQDLQKISVPTKLIVGTHDRPVYLSNLAKISMPKNIKLHTINTGHHAPRQNPKLIASFFTN